MRKVFLEQNLGKKSKCRFPKKNPKQIVIKLMIEAQKAVSTPSLTQPLVISGVPVIDFCDRFNQLTTNFESGLPIRSRVVVNSLSKSFDLELFTPSVFKLMARVFQNNKKKKQQILQLMHNLALIKLITEFGNSYYLLEIRNVIKQIAGNLRSYELRLNRKI